LAHRLQLRRDTTTNWSSVNPILAEGELGFDTDTGQLKLGDGTTAWNDLDYYGLGLTADQIDDSASTNKFTTAAEKATWDGKQDALGYTAENSANKENTDITTDTTKYPTVNLLKTGLDAKSDTTHDHDGDYEASGAITTHAGVADAHHTRYVDSEARKAIPWDPSTNSPSLSNGTGESGELYVCISSGTVNFGAGNITFGIGDLVQYNGSTWNKVSRFTWGYDDPDPTEGNDTDFYIKLQA
jgi:hypothetical protein